MFRQADQWRLGATKIKIKNSKSNEKWGIEKGQKKEVLFIFPSFHFSFSNGWRRRNSTSPVSFLLIEYRLHSLSVNISISNGFRVGFKRKKTRWPGDWPSDWPTCPSIRFFVILIKILKWSKVVQYFYPWTFISPSGKCAISLPLLMLAECRAKMNSLRPPIQR
jgi:hypothetical protein